ncbi:unnamed protein product [Acanthoscelides obtectus]|uniref:Uncharacterized protein n=1 Tax=Acanthoscelides obtectus TaxID=200917 RepID=A0A9P0QCT6_ACAOB|nr:unnamed protein product [Acanthoscelides obtectus]CAK1682693.1 hypothetical protein AOBTE_LOCUS33799 [Acanthoscelides obtectus]
MNFNFKQTTFHFSRLEKITYDNDIDITKQKTYTLKKA